MRGTLLITLKEDSTEGLRKDCPGGHWVVSSEHEGESFAILYPGVLRAVITQRPILIAELALATERFADSSESIALFEPLGVGKTRSSLSFISSYIVTERLKETHHENHFPKRLKALAEYKLPPISGEVGCPADMGVKRASPSLRLIARRYEMVPAIFTLNKRCLQWNQAASALFGKAASS